MTAADFAQFFFNIQMALIHYVMIEKQGFFFEQVLPRVDETKDMVHKLGTIPNWITRCPFPQIPDSVLF
jgi:hypothetical protein